MASIVSQVRESKQNANPPGEVCVCGMSTSTPPVDPERTRERVWHEGKQRNTREATRTFFVFLSGIKKMLCVYVVLQSLARLMIPPP